jgi:argininosuccinate synthase|tara:strand:- start:336 stop:602 length:267 start_codon:yes stop_codon:yes gene_type:complete
MDTNTLSGHENLQTGDLENAINSAKSAGDEAVAGEKPKMSQEEEIGFHKGALNTLMAERAELVKMVGNVEAIAGAHAKRLKEMGVDLK